MKRKFEIGPEFGNQEIDFRVWAPKVNQVHLVLESEPYGSFKLNPEGNGYFSGTFQEPKEGSLYRFRLDNRESLYADPASRYQPQGPHGPSQIIHPNRYQWKDVNWKGIDVEHPIIYELHIGTFTEEGTWESAKKELPHLVDLGITIIEMMPVNEFPGKFGWGYDGVNIFAPYHHYGKPDDLKDFIDYAHSLNLGVILDVVYNHFGPDGNYLPSFSDQYFTPHYKTDWGDGVNFDGEESENVRRYFINNAGYWIGEFHFDGLRLDATHSIFDRSNQHIIQNIQQEVKARAKGRNTYVIAENDLQPIHFIQSEDKGGYNLNGVWNDDFHHTAMVRLTGRKDNYYSAFLGSSQEFISALKYGYLYQGQWYSWLKAKRGTADFTLNPSLFVHFLQNHDQIANSAHGYRLHALSDPANFRAMTALFLLASPTPLLFQGQEFGASSPFNYFADHHKELSKLIKKGRKEFLQQFPSIADPEMSERIQDPSAIETFQKCKLNFSEREKNKEFLDLHRDLIKLRKEDPIFNKPRPHGVDGSVLNNDAFLIRYFGCHDQEQRLMIVNFGSDFHLSPAPEPLLAPPHGTGWSLLWSSESPKYGGSGIPFFTMEDNFRIIGHSTIVLKAC